MASRNVASKLQLRASGLHLKVTTATSCSLRRAFSTTRFLCDNINIDPTNLPFPVFRAVPQLRTFRKSLTHPPTTPQKSSNDLQAPFRVGLVPTMGALHAGHLDLVRLAARENDAVIVSIFVNPTQFGANEDLSTYPRTWDADMSALLRINAELASAGSGARGRVAAIFAPTAKEMYPTLPPAQTLEGDGSFVTITPLGRILEGASRPVFFRGVATVVLKLLNVTAPDRLYLGQKDVQQCAVVRRMVKDLHVDTEVRIGPTVREKDGLALSSRNAYLGTRRRAFATTLVKALRAVEEKYASGVLAREELRGAGLAVFERAAKEQNALSKHQRVGFDLDYLSLADPDDMTEVQMVDPKKGAVLSAAMIVEPVEESQEGEDLGSKIPQGKVRLIDNIILRPVSQ